MGMVQSGVPRQPNRVLSLLWSNPVPRGFLLTGLTLVGLIGELAAARAGQDGLEQVFYLVAFLAGGVPSALAALQTLLKEHKLDVNLLMVIAALGALSVGQAADGVILLFLFSLSNTLQDWAFTRTRRAIEALMALRPEGATVRRGDQEVWVSLEDLQVGDLMLVRPGERFAADARLEEGHTYVDESAITGESVPVHKGPGDVLKSGTLNGQGVVAARVERPASESTLARLIQLVEAARAAKSPTEQFAARLEGPYTLAVLLSVPLIYGLMHYLLGLSSAEAWYRAMTFLVVASPCAVVISTPVAVLSAMAAGARAGVLFKSGAALEALAQARIVAFDKTGTLTEGRMRLVELLPLEGSRDQAHALAAGLERYSEHPIAKAITAAFSGEAAPVTAVQALRGKGIVGELQGQRVWAGTRILAEEQGASLSAFVQAHLERLEGQGFTTLLLGRENRIVALLAVADTPRPEAAAAVKALRRRGLRVVMLSGDRLAVAQHIAQAIGVPEVRAELLPEEKLRIIADLRAEGRVAMVGDGVNDAPALVSADVGISMAAGSDVALESADAVLMNNDLSRLSGALALARAANRTVRFNLLLALSVIVVVGALALLGQVPLPLGVLAHEGGTVFVVMMGLRLLGFRDFGPSPSELKEPLELETAAS
ncbi:heavy metal translocating P-type ATPase [Meiothermus granaticius]|uniref:Zinc-transporting ATPase n=1 Tax=Meiothermus granaticius NBRC 107808 TaxID=1227551 RepID=A0A399FF36_9DEIN|nr:cation-translocating P-type ATPase [Meiothermus granaticius]RIH93691.1 Zinc-transporting ATPase [Meiothermus granaticius NBRC 107808]GEM85785.1 heavy metal-(Cd/Co/Hg/Pb/Zn)-translocating P-type ATPase [Meiothermus granaticius NBRC 107808]